MSRNPGVVAGNPGHPAIDREDRRTLTFRLARCVAAVVLFLIVPAPTSAHAGLVLGFGASQYSVNPGQSIDVPVFLTESGTNILATDGLNSAGLIVSFNLSPKASDPAQAMTFTPNSGVNDLDDFVFTSITPATSSQAGTAALEFSIVQSDLLKPPTGSSAILLGTLQFVAGPTPGQATTLSTGLFSGGPQFFSGAGQILDEMITTHQSVITTSAVQAVPEPSCLVLFSTGLLGLGGSACWRRFFSRRSRVHSSHTPRHPPLRT